MCYGQLWAPTSVWLRDGRNGFLLENNLVLTSARKRKFQAARMFRRGFDVRAGARSVSSVSGGGGRYARGVGVWACVLVAVRLVWCER